jgi:hypothetical protein
MIEKTAIIKPCAKKDIDPDRPLSEQRICLYSKKNPGKLLGRHPNEESAKKQEAVIQIHKHAGLAGKSLQTFLLYEVAKRVVNYVKGQKLRKPAEQVWTELFSKRFKISTRGVLKRGAQGGQYKIEGSILFTQGNHLRPINVTLVAAYWKFKLTVLIQFKERGKLIFSSLDKDTKKVIKETSAFISQNLIYPPLTAGDEVVVTVHPHKGRKGTVRSYWDYTQRALIVLEPRPNVPNDLPQEVWFDRNQVDLMTDKITKQFQATILKLQASHPDLAQRLAKAKEKYQAKTALEKMIGEMAHGQSGLWLSKEQMQSVVKELHKQGIKKPDKGKYDEIAQAVGKILDKLIPDAGDKKDPKKGMKIEVEVEIDTESDSGDEDEEDEDEDKNEDEGDEGAWGLSEGLPMVLDPNALVTADADEALRLLANMAADEKLAESVDPKMWHKIVAKIPGVCLFNAMSYQKLQLKINLAKQHIANLKKAEAAGKKAKAEQYALAVLQLAGMKPEGVVGLVYWQKHKKEIMSWIKAGEVVAKMRKKGKGVEGLREACQQKKMKRKKAQVAAALLERGQNDSALRVLESLVEEPQD